MPVNASSTSGGGTPDAGGNGGVSGNGNNNAGGGQDWGFLPEGMTGLKDDFSTPADFWAKTGNLVELAKEKDWLGSAQVPDTLAAPEDLEKFWQRAGKPEKLDGYTLPEFSAEGMAPESIAAVNEVLSASKAEFAEMAHAANLTTKQAETFYKAVGELVAKVQGEAPDVDKTLTDLWGKEKDKNLDLARRGARTAGLGNELDAAGLSAHPLVLRLCAALGGAHAEDVDKRKGGSGEGSLPAGQAAYQELLRVVSSDAYRRQEASAVKLAETLSARVNI